MKFNISISDKLSIFSSFSIDWIETGKGHHIFPHCRFGFIKTNSNRSLKQRGQLI